MATEEEMTAEEKLEYETSIELYKKYMSLRRKDIAFNTTAQVALMTILKDDLLKMDWTNYIFALIALPVLFIGLNNERRISAYLQAYKNRGIEIEKKYRMTLLAGAKDAVKKTDYLISNRVAFTIYYLLFIIFWILLLGYNLIL